jgi:hypothetical protein
VVTEGICSSPRVQPIGASGDERRARSAETDLPRRSAPRRPLSANPIVSSGNLWMIEAVVSDAATAWVVDASSGYNCAAAPAHGKQ